MIHASDTPAIKLMTQLRHAGWSLDDSAFWYADDGLVWVVSGVNDENQIRAEGATSAEAWQAAVEQA